MLISTPLFLWFGWIVRAGRHTDLGGLILAPVLFLADFSYFYYTSYVRGFSWKLGLASLVLGAIGFLYGYFYGRDETSVVSTKSANVEATRVNVEPEPLVGDFIIAWTLLLFFLTLSFIFKQNLIARGVSPDIFVWLNEAYLFVYFILWPPVIGYFLSLSFFAYQSVKEARAHQHTRRH